ncbi:GGDEF domain-containing protein [Enterovibrio norvegicus]|uniref:GGDEF domain-containing protein n=1 Tax=Enterovibrio norvegicus TaxID=188144 RepID=UPI00354B973C
MALNVFLTRWIFHLFTWSFLVVFLVWIVLSATLDDAGIYEEMLCLGLGISMAYECVLHKKTLKERWLWLGWAIFGVGNLLDVLDEIINNEELRLLYLDTSLKILGIMVICYAFLKQILSREKLIHRLAEEARINTSLRDRLYRDARIDELTQLGNRRACFEKMNQLNKTNDVLYYLDLDNFKQCNDSYGHQVGDKVLNIFGRYMTEYFGTHLSFRVGGDEFVAFGPGKEDLDTLTKKLVPGIEKYGVSVSIGMIELSAHKNIDDLLNMADQEMYRVKFRRQPRV